MNCKNLQKILFGLSVSSFALHASNLDFPSPHASSPHNRVVYSPQKRSNEDPISCAIVMSDYDSGSYKNTVAFIEVSIELFGKEHAQTLKDYIKQLSDVVADDGKIKEEEIKKMFADNGGSLKQEKSSLSVQGEESSPVSLSHQETTWFSADNRVWKTLRSTACKVFALQDPSSIHGAVGSDKDIDSKIKQTKLRYEGYIKTLKIAEHLLKSTKAHYDDMERSLRLEIADLEGEAKNMNSKVANLELENESLKEQVTQTEGLKKEQAETTAAENKALQKAILQLTNEKKKRDADSASQAPSGRSNATSVLRPDVFVANGDIVVGERKQCLIDALKAYDETVRKEATAAAAVAEKAKKRRV